MWLLALLLQGPTTVPTVGDTIWLSRTVDLPVGYDVRPASWESSGAVELLGAPTVSWEGRRVTIRYPAVAWEPGRHAVLVPGPLLLSPDGGTDSLPPQPLTLVVASVLPPAAADSALPPQPEAGVIHRPQHSPWPLLLLWGVVLALMAPAVSLWRRRGRRASRRGASPRPLPPVDRWAEAGEHRAVAAAASVDLRASIARRVPEAHLGLDAETLLSVLSWSRPAWPLEDIGRVVRQLEAARFAPVAGDAAPELYRRATDLSRTIGKDRP